MLFNYWCDISLSFFAWAFLGTFLLFYELVGGLSAKAFLTFPQILKLEFIYIVYRTKFMLLYYFYNVFINEFTLSDELLILLGV